MIFKSGMGWRCCCDPETGLYTAEIGGGPNHDLYEITKEIFDRVDDPAVEWPTRLIHEGRHLYMAVDDRCGPPYTVILDSDYQKLCPWAKTMHSGTIWDEDMTDAAVEVFASEAKNRPQRRAKKAAREKKKAEPELWDLYNEKRELTGRDQVRGEAVPEGYYHLVVHVWIRNSKGEYLISQRSADRPEHPLKWECVGGSALKGEDSLAAALRETAEEVGVSLSPEKGKLIESVVGRVVNGVKFSDIVDIWLFEYDGPVDLARASTKEVAQTAWMTKRQAGTLFETGRFVDTLGYFFQTEAI